MAAFELVNSSLYTDANLQSYYRMEGNSNDSKGSANGTDTNITYSAGNGKFTQGAGFNGTDSNITIGTGFNFNEITIMAWVKQTNDASENEIISKWGGGANKFVIGVDGTNKPFAKFITAGGENSLAGASNFPDATYTMITATWNATTGGALYINDTSVDTDNTFSGNLSSSSQTATIGALTGGTLFWPGQIDDLAIFNRALTATEVSNHFNGLDPLTATTNNLRGYFDV